MRQVWLENFQSSRNRSLPALLTGVMLALAAVPVLMLSKARSPSETMLVNHSRPALAALGHREIRIDERADGSAAVLDAASAAELATMKPGEGGFVRTMLRLLVLERRRHNAPVEPPFRVTQWNSGGVTIEDPVLGTNIEVKAFGATNAAAFAQLIDVRRNAP